MKYSNYQETEKGYKIKGHSGFLNFILKIYCKKIAKKFKKIHNLPKEMKLNVRPEINIIIDEVKDE